MVDVHETKPFLCVQSKQGNAIEDATVSGDAQTDDLKAKDEKIKEFEVYIQFWITFVPTRYTVKPKTNHYMYIMSIVVLFSCSLKMYLGDMIMEGCSQCGQAIYLLHTRLVCIPCSIFTAY